MRRATSAVAPMLSPSAMTKTTVSAVSVSPTVATASAPRRDTQNTSTRPNSDSMHISSTIGTASRTMARAMLPSVKSWLVPMTASRREDHRPGVRSWIVLLVSLMENPQDLNVPRPGLSSRVSDSGSINGQLDGRAGSAAERLRRRPLTGGDFEISRASHHDEKLAGRAFRESERQAGDDLESHIQSESMRP